MRKYVDPVVTPDPHVERQTQETHPSYAQIACSRVSGRSVLYGSNFDHQHYMTVRISRSQLMRDLNRDWYFPREEYIEVAMSEAQWATFISSPNSGTGIPCTLQRRNGELIPGIPKPTDRTIQFKTEADKTLTEAKERLKDLIEQVDGLKLSEKAKNEVKSSIHTIQQRLGDSIEFVAKQFSEHVENTIEAAKVEINAHAQQTLVRTGLSAIQGIEQPIRLAIGGNEPAAIDAETVTDGQG